MAVQVSYPGVYIQEERSGIRTITGVSTSTALFIGTARKGEVGVPRRILGFEDFGRRFGADFMLGEMAWQVLQFFGNGGREAYILRVADAAAVQASATVENGAGADVLVVSARDPGSDGNLIRVEVDVPAAGQRGFFGLTAYRRRTDAIGRVTLEERESLTNLSMDPTSGRFAPTVVNASSELIRLAAADLAMLDRGGISRSALAPPLPANDVAAHAQLAAAITGATNAIDVSIDGQPPVTVVLTNLGATLADLMDEWRVAIDTAISTAGQTGTVTVSVPAGPARQIEIATNNPGSIVISPAGVNDATAVLALGVAEGGTEGANHGGLSRSNLNPALPAIDADVRTRLAATITPTANAIAVSIDGQSPRRVVLPIAGATLADLLTGWTNAINTEIALGGQTGTVEVTVPAAAPRQIEIATTHATGRSVAISSAGVNDATGVLALGVAGGGTEESRHTFFHPLPTAGQPAYSLGTATTNAAQSAQTAGGDGGLPTTTRYAEMFTIARRDIDLFNLMVLPRAAVRDGAGALITQADAQRLELWAPASAFCQSERAFLVMDPPEDWDDAEEASNQIAGLRLGMVQDHTAIYWPRIRLARDGIEVEIDPAGTVAGVMARIDGSRGVWKAPAGIEADARGARGVEYRMSDGENGFLNPLALNALRVFPAGIVVWGARTMAGFDNSGNDDYKYVPVRRLALFLEESLYRGLTWAVFEPNAEPLWAQLRLAAGAFMNNLFRQGAFKGEKSSDAYFVKCDAETTTQNEINLGIVNLLVGFAPLKPAEFVVVTIRQLAGQVQT